MRERAFVHVAGPPGSGKTTFIEAMLAVVDGPVLAARCIRDDALRQARETATKDHKLNSGATRRQGPGALPYSPSLETSSARTPSS